MVHVKTDANFIFHVQPLHLQGQEERRPPSLHATALVEVLNNGR